MGRAFKAPRKSDAQQWKKVELLWRAGFRFVQFPSASVERFPDHLREVEDFIRRNPNHPLRLVR